MKVNELKRDMDEQFGHVREQFKHVDAQFRRVDERFEQIDERFARVEVRFTSLEQHVDAAEERTRGRFEVVMEQVRADVKLTLEAVVTMDDRMARFMATNAREHAQFERVLLDHDARLRAIENRR